MLFPPARGYQQMPTNGAASRLRAPVCPQGDRSCPGPPMYQHSSLSSAAVH